MRAQRRKWSRRLKIFLGHGRKRGPEAAVEYKHRFDGEKWDLNRRLLYGPDVAL